MADYDVIVIGSGVAGLAAALTAAESGASVLVLESETRTGGSSRLSGGHVYAAGTSIQRAAGIEDSADAMYHHYMTLNQWLVEPAVVRRYCDTSAETIEWLLAKGLRFPTDDLYQSGVGRTPRGHPPEGGGEAVVQALEGHCSALGVDVVLNTRISELLRGAAGGVTGVRAGGDSVSAGAVVVATGGFGANPELIQRHYPDAARAGNWSWYIGADGARGDGLALGEAAGAALDGHNRGLLLVTPGFSRDLEVLLPPWLILVNERGRRFASETAPYTVLGGLILHQNGPVFAIFDETARRHATRSPMSQAYWVDEVLERQADEGRVLRAVTPAALAEACGIDAAALEGTIGRYNEDVGSGVDTAFFKPIGERVKPIETPPYYAAEVRPAIVCWTGTGLRIDADTRVLSKLERPIPGLYAAGETVGSLHGDRYIGGGGSFGPCIVFGRLAGANAAARARTD